MPDNQVKIRVGADLTQTDAALDAFAGRAGDSFAKVGPAIEEVNERTGQLNAGILSARESARLATEELGIRLPRGVTSGVARMLPEIGMLGPALLGAFAIAEIPRFISLVDDATSALGGYTEEVKKAEKADIDASTAALIHFKTIADGTALVAETNRRLAEIAAKGSDWKEQAKAANDAITSTKGLLIDLLGPIGGAINAYRGYKAAVQEVADTKGQTGKLQQRLDEQLLQLGELEEKQQKELAKDAKFAGEAAYQAAMKKYEANQRAFHASEEALRREMALQDRLGREAVEAAHREGEAREHTAEAIKRVTAELARQREQEARSSEELGKEAARDIGDINRIGKEQATQTLRGKGEARQRIEDQHNAAVAAIQAKNQEAQAIAALKGDYKALADAALAAYEAMGAAAINYGKLLQEQGQAEKKAAQDAMNAAIGQVSALAEGAARLVKSKRPYYAVKAAEEVAAGIECIAEGTWPPNPLAMVAAGIHFESAAEYAKIAGTSAHRGSSGPSGASAGAGAGGYGERGGRDGEYNIPPQTLAPGADGGGRFRSPGSGVVIIKGEQAFVEYTAAAVNAAHSQGINMTVAYAQRGTYVGH